MSIALIRPKTLCAWKGPSLLIVNTRGDFADIQEAQSGKREQNADVETTTGATGIALIYRHTRLRYRSSLEVIAHADWTITPSRIATRVSLEPQTSIELSLRISASTADG